METSERLFPGYTIGIGLTDRCNADCPHCYSRPEMEPADLNPDQLETLLTSIPVKSLNFGTGESILYPGFVDLVQRLAQRKIPMSLTTNGYTVEQLSDAELQLFHDIDFSLDFSQKELNDQWRGVGSFDAILDGARRCRDLGVEASLVTCLMNVNAAHMGKLAELALALGLSLRVNVYKPVSKKELCPSYEEFWQALADLASVAYFTACSEPIVKAALNHREGIEGSPCGQRSFRLRPDGRVVPCVYLDHADVYLADLCTDFENGKKKLNRRMELPVPLVCRDCQHFSICRGGCVSRRILHQPEEPDQYCFVVRDHQPHLPARWKKSKGLVHEDYLCTMIFSA